MILAFICGLLSGVILSWALGVCLLLGILAHREPADDEMQAAIERLRADAALDDYERKVQAAGERMLATMDRDLRNRWEDEG